MGLRFAFHEGLGFVEYYPVEDEQVSDMKSTGGEGETLAFQAALEPKSCDHAHSEKQEPVSRITCELKITKTWEEQNLTGI